VGIAIGEVYLGGPAPAARPAGGAEVAAPATAHGVTEHGVTEHGATADEVRAAFAAVAADRFALAERLRAEDRADQAAIVEVGGLMAGDPALADAAVAAVRSGTEAVAAVTGAAEAQAAILAALPSPDLAARADDVRQVGQAVVAQLAVGATVPPPDGDFILIGREVDPADLIRLADVGLAGAVSVSGGANSHAAIIARGLGLPMLAGADPAVLDVPPGHPALLDATNTAGARLVIDPDPATPPPATKNSAASSVTEGAGDTSVHRTADGQQVTLLVNAASAREVRMGLAAGAAGVGLLRTEIPFLRATAWPTRLEHEAALAPPLRLLAGRPAVVRLLDFSGDKVPPFLAGSRHANGLTALLEAPRALRDQLLAILAVGRATELRIMVPMVTTVEELAQVKAALTEAAEFAVARAY
jgi:phosphoenolpyruvate-protein kinase (PTS system EI component)